MSIEDRHENSVFRSHIGEGWRVRFKEEKKVFVIIEPHAKHTPTDCEKHLYKLEVPFQKRSLTSNYLLATFPTEAFLDPWPVWLSESPKPVIQDPIIQRIQKDPGPIRFIWYDAPMVVQTQDSVPLVGAADQNDPNFGSDFGEGVTWALIDTGVNAAHPHFANTTIEQYRIDSTSTPPPLPSPHDLTGWLNLKENPTDTHGHGTHVAGIITGAESNGTRRGVAPKTSLISYRLATIKGNECGREGDVIAVLEHLVVRKRKGHSVPAGVNISLSVKLNSQDERVSEAPICKAVDAAVDAGFIVVVAAGNYGADTVQPNQFLFREISLPNPANAYSAIVVGACYKDRPTVKGVWHRSSRGPTADGRSKPDLVAPGTDIESATIATTSGYKTLSGTSQAAPHVSGVICALLSESAAARALRPEDILRLLKNTALSLGRNEYYQGSGLVQLKAALKQLEEV